MKGINQATNPCIQSPSDHPQEKDIQRETITITGARDQCEDYPSENDPNISISSTQCCGSGSIFGRRIMIQEQGNWPKLTNILVVEPVKINFVATYLSMHVLWNITYLHKVDFSCQNSTLCDGKVQPRSGSACFHIVLAPYIRIQIYLDPDPHWNQMRIRNTANSGDGDIGWECYVSVWQWN